MKTIYLCLALLLCPFSEAAGNSQESNAASTHRSDFDNDRTIGFTDFLYFVGHYGKDAEDPTWDAKADLDKNGRIDFSDFLAFARSYGQTVPLLSGQVTDVLTGRAVQGLKISLGARTTVTDSAGRYAFESGILPAPTDVLSIAGGDSFYNYSATVSDSDYVWDIQMIERFNDPNKPEIDGLERLKWFYFGARKKGSFRLKRHLVENGPILVYFRDEHLVSKAYNDAVWAGLKEWENQTNAHLPQGRKIDLFKKTDYDPTRYNIEEKTGKSIESGKTGTAGGWMIAYDHPNSGQFSPGNRDWFPSKQVVDPDFPVYGILQLRARDVSPDTLASDQLVALTSHEAGRGFGYFINSDRGDDHVMSISNSARTPPIHVTPFEGRINAVNLKLKNNTDLSFYSK